MSTQKWEGRDEELLDLVKMQAGVASALWALTDVPLAAVMRLMPPAAELEELGRQFYYTGNVQNRTEQAISGSLNADDVSLSTIEPFVPSNQALEELERQFYGSPPNIPPKLWTDGPMAEGG
jgi:hypothetical protein